MLAFLISLIADINFKISLASIKIIYFVLANTAYKNKTHYTALVDNLVEKLSDSKQVVRNVTLDCCTKVIQKFNAASFVTQTTSMLTHANWHVREGVLTLLARC